MLPMMRALTSKLALLVVQKGIFSARLGLLLSLFLVLRTTAV